MEPTPLPITSPIISDLTGPRPLFIKLLVTPVRIPGMIIAGIPVVVVKAHGNSVLYVIRVAMVPGDRGMC